jgi:hypothetical protein
MTEADYLEFRFVLQELKRWGLELRELTVNTIISKDIVSAKDTEHLRDNITLNVTKEGEKGGRLQFTFPDKGRLVEIMFRKTGSRARLTSRATTTEVLYGIKSRAKTRKKKDTRWYNSNVFGMLYTLIGRLSYGYTEAVRLDLRKRLIDPYKTA